MSTQPQLLQIPLDPGDVVYTPDWVARDMVEFFRPSGRILEPCKGDGVFMKYLPPHTEWCEISEGRDFFQWQEPVDWVFGNPPYRLLTDWMNHSFKIANHIVYLIPSNAHWNSLGRLKRAISYGGMIHTRMYGNGTLFGKNYGYPVGAVYFQRDYHGPMYTTIYEET